MDPNDPGEMGTSGATKRMGWSRGDEEDDDPLA